LRNTATVSVLALCFSYAKRLTSATILMPGATGFAAWPPRAPPLGDERQHCLSASDRLQSFGLAALSVGFYR
jgi:hypothetical protein